MIYRRMHIFGGANGIGRWFAEKIFLSRLPGVFVYDVDQSALMRLQSDIHRVPLALSPDYKQAAAGIMAGDWVAFAVPVHLLPAVISGLSPHLPNGCLLVDFSSVKEGPLGVLRANAPGHATLLGIHPLFGPLISSPVGQIVALTTVTGHCPQTTHFRDVLQSAGLLVSEVEPAQHDEAMAFVQALTHFAYLSFAKAVVAGGQTFSALSGLRTPPFHFLSAFAGRILSGSPPTYVHIQRTSAAKRIRRIFLEAASELDSAFAAEELDRAIAAFEAIRAPLSGSEITECTSISRLATDTLERFEQRLHQLRERKDIVVFRTSDNNTLHVGRVETVGTDSVVFTEPIKKIATPDGQRYAIALNDEAVRNYRRRGIEFGVPPANSFMKRKIIFLSDNEQETWLQQNLLLLKRSASFSRSGPFEPEVLEQLIPRFVRHVYRIVFLDLYRRRNEPENLTLEIEFRPDVPFEAIRTDIQDFITMFRATNGT